jgi:drug/metabolite transporter (DMT)-like permease
METWVGALCALSSAGIWAFSATYITVPARIYGGRATNLFKSTVGAAMFLLSVLAWLGPSGFDASGGAYARFMASGLLGLAIADTGYLSALRHIGPFLTALVYQTSGIITAIVGAAALDETLSATEVAGMASVIAGVILALFGRRHAPIDGARPLRGVAYALVAATFHAVGVVYNKGAFHVLAAEDGLQGPRAAVLGGCVRMTTAAVALFLLAALTGSLRRQTRIFREPAGRRMAFLPAFFGTFVAMVTMQLAIVSLKSGVASVLLSMTTIFTIPVAWWVLGERPTVRSVLGAVIALAGAWLLAEA